MDKELLDLLNNARAAGASKEQLLGIASAYNQKKKSGDSGLEGSSEKSVPGTSVSPSPESNTATPANILKPYTG
ncbi:MAG TPA: hypothetical protein VJ279_05085, partial [Hanamia sp.]|nr:hypothetical protein [Hanamia sp.]